MKERDRFNDWEGARERLAAGRDALEGAFAPTAEQVEGAFRKRAAQLARPAVPRPAGDEAGVLVFEAGGGRYGIELDRLAAVMAAGPCSPVPGAPPELAGVMQVRGEIRPVWEASRLLGREEDTGGEGTHVLLLRAVEREVGLRVGGVSEIRRVAPGDRRPAAGQPPWVRYVTPDLVAVVDTEELLKQRLS